MDDVDNKDVEELKRELEKTSETLKSIKTVGLLIFTVLIVLTVFGFIFGTRINEIDSSLYRIEQDTETVADNTEKPTRILVLSLENDISDDDVSDKTQVDNALSNGGMIRIDNTNEGYESAFGTVYKSYGASNASNYMWTWGAVMNYIASKGWKLVQSPSSGLSSYYYFEK